MVIFTSMISESPFCRSHVTASWLDSGWTKQSTSATAKENLLGAGEGVDVCASVVRVKPQRIKATAMAEGLQTPDIVKTTDCMEITHKLQRLWSEAEVKGGPTVYEGGDVMSCWLWCHETSEIWKQAFASARKYTTIVDDGTSSAYFFFLNYINIIDIR